MSNTENEIKEIPLEQLIRAFKREGIENFITIRRAKYNELVKENEKLKKSDDKDFTLIYMQGYQECKIKYRAKIRKKIDVLENELNNMDEIEFALYEDTIREKIKIYKDLLEDN